MELDIAPAVCRYDGCILGPDGGPAPLVQPVRGGNIREYCSDRHRIAAHRARQRRPVAPYAPAHDRAGMPSIGAASAGPPSAVAAALTSLAADLGRLAADVDRALTTADADRVARELQDARLRVAEAEARAAAATEEASACSARSTVVASDDSRAVRRAVAASAAPTASR